MAELDQVKKVIRNANPNGEWSACGCGRCSICMSGTKRNTILEDVLLAISRYDIKVDSFTLYGDEMSILMTDKNGDVFVIYWQLNKSLDRQEEIVKARVCRAFENIKI